MELQPWLEWMKTTLDQRFNELAKIAGEYQVQPIDAKKLDEIVERLKSELTFTQYQLVLEWDEIPQGGRAHRWQR